MKHTATAAPYRASREESENIVRMLCDGYPKAFFDNPRQRRPLKKNIAADIIVDNILQVADELIIAGVDWYTSNIGYSGYAMSVAGAARIDLSGNAVGTVTPKEAAEAQIILNEYHARKNEQANSPNGKVDDYSGVRKIVETPIVRTKAPQIATEFIGLYDALVVAATTVSSISEPGMRLVVAKAALSEVIRRAEQTRQELDGDKAL